jgi:HlyD family type I secretion membrane fusion protein
VGEVVGAFESDTVAVFLRTAPANENLTLYVLSAMIILAVVLSAFVKLDRVVTSQEGWIFPSAGSLYISPFDIGIVKSVNVKVGDVVKKGQSLATLDPTFTQADLTQLREHMASDVAQIAREKAELERRAYVYDVKDHYQALQGELWKQRQGEFKATVENYQSQIKSTQAQLGQAQSDVEKYTTRLKLWDDMNDMYKPLVEKGYAANLQLLQTTDSRTEVNRLLNDAKQQVPQYTETIGALKAQLDTYIKTWDATTSTQLVADENDRDTTQDALDKAEKMQELTSLDAPQDAVVVKIGQVSKGSVQAGAAGSTSNLQQDPLFTLQPLNAPVEGELDIASQDIGFVRVGDNVILKVDAFPYIRFGVVDAAVKFISESSYSIDQNGASVPPFFKVRVTIKNIRFHNVPSTARLVPGMTAVGDIKVGDRTIMSYVTEGALRMGQEAMREP